MMRALRIGLALAVVVGVTVSAADWPQWRGPHGSGMADDKNLPERWSATENVAWKARLGGVGVSSPIVSGNAVFVTSQIGTGAEPSGTAARAGRGCGRRRGALDLPAADRPPTRWSSSSRRSIARPDSVCGNTGWTPWARSSRCTTSTTSPRRVPVTDGQLVYAWFGTGQIVALDMSGKVVWQRHLGQEISPFDINWGHSSSPTLYEDSLILLCDHAPASYLLGRGQEDRQGQMEGRPRQGTPVVHHAVRRAGEQRSRARRELERARRRLRPADRHVPVARRRDRISFRSRCRRSATASST